MERRILAIGSFMGFLAVVMGTFGAHILNQRLSPRLLEVFETGVAYHTYHSLAIVATAWVGTRYDGRWPKLAALGFIVGIIIFSGSLYLLALTGATWLGMITPIGGLSFLAGWIALMTTAVTSRPATPE